MAGKESVPDSNQGARSGSELAPYVISLFLESRIIIDRDTVDFGGRPHSTLPLLQDVAKLVAEKPTPPRRIRFELTRGEMNIATLCIGKRAHFRRFIRIRMYPNRREIGAQSVLELSLEFIRHPGSVLFSLGDGHGMVTEAALQPLPLHGHPWTAVNGVLKRTLTGVGRAFSLDGAADPRRLHRLSLRRLFMGRRFGLHEHILGFPLAPLDVEGVLHPGMPDN